ncbi:Germ cell-less protein-like 1 [Trichoplax sp. H2]|nr:Germ cell-less protein-like 1 [Trichoplax sp. H2]|eukprot:RDD47182.1 Germ cell-less protein-like 1 [Trichoplax sp. H2]
MGNYFFRKELTEDSNYDHSVQFKRPQNKRKRTINQNEDTEDATDSLQACTKRQRNDEAIYHQYTLSKLFFNDENGDTTIEALGYKWKMHKICLIRAGYFKSMFSGFWQESKATYVKIEMIDKNITVNAINTAFASLYDDDTEIKSSEAISIVAVATMLQIDNLIKRCTDVMIATISEENERTFREAASAYGLLEVSNRCMDWLALRLLTIKRYDLMLLQSIDVNLMEKIVSSPSLLVLQVEMDVYAMLKRWMYLRLHPTWCKNHEHVSLCEAFKYVLNDMQSYYEDHTGSTNFLVTEEGKVFSLAFRQLKFNHIITDTKIARQIEKDRIISQVRLFTTQISEVVLIFIDWLLPIYRQEWRTLLAVEEGDDFGPTSCCEKQFYNNCIRLGRMIEVDCNHHWRWIGFRFGIDIIINYYKSPKRISLKRNISEHDVAMSLSLENSRCIMTNHADSLNGAQFYRFIIINYGKDCQINHETSTDILYITLHPDEEITVAHINQEFGYPLYIGVQMLVTSPSIAS